jgi:hypothetical protein
MAPFTQGCAALNDAASFRVSPHVAAPQSDNCTRKRHSPLDRAIPRMLADF